MPPGRRFAVLTCVDARLDPAKFAGLSEGAAHVIRHAGGRARDDAIPSLRHFVEAAGHAGVFVIQHTNSGMKFFTDELMRGLLANSLEAAALGAGAFHDIGKGPGSTDGEYY
jgi:carbonic anhydrase